MTWQEKAVMNMSWICHVDVPRERALQIKQKQFAHSPHLPLLVSISLEGSLYLCQWHTIYQNSTVWTVKYTILSVIYSNINCMRILWPHHHPHSLIRLYYIILDYSRSQTYSSSQLQQHHLVCRYVPHTLFTVRHCSHITICDILSVTDTGTMIPLS